MYIPKRYGESKVDKCPFCNHQATTLNSQKVPVCLDHKTAILEDMKCICGQYLEMKTGKFGVFFSCLNCGNLNLRKVLEINQPKAQPSQGLNPANPVRSAVPHSSASQKESPNPRQEKENIVYPGDPRYFD